MERQGGNEAWAVTAGRDKRIRSRKAGEVPTQQGPTSEVGRELARACSHKESGSFIFL